LCRRGLDFESGCALGPDRDGDWYCLDLAACNRRAGKRLGVVENKRKPGRIGGREGRRRLALCLAACDAYRARQDGSESVAAVSIDLEAEPGLEQLQFEEPAA
jgi:hypothetical protein